MAKTSSSRRSNPKNDNMRPVAVCTIFGGPNGSGKSSIFDALAPPGEFVNTDVVARRINPDNPEAASLAAGREALRRLHDIIDKRHDFAFETTLSSNQSLTLMRKARDAEYEVGLVFVALANADLSVERVAQRVKQGGHNIKST